MRENNEKEYKRIVKIAETSTDIHLNFYKSVIEAYSYVAEVGDEIELETLGRKLTPEEREDYGSPGSEISIDILPAATTDFETKTQEIIEEEFSKYVKFSKHVNVPKTITGNIIETMYYLLENGVPPTEAKKELYDILDEIRDSVKRKVIEVLIKNYNGKVKELEQIKSIET